MTDVSCPVLSGTVKAATDATPERGSKVTVAVRPEKITITRKAPSGGVNVVRGTVRDLGYFGKDSLYRVKLASGHLVLVNSVNARRVDEGGRVAQWEDEVWLILRTILRHPADGLSMRWRRAPALVQSHGLARPHHRDALRLAASSSS